MSAKNGFSVKVLLLAGSLAMAPAYAQSAAGEVASHPGSAPATRMSEMVLQAGASSDLAQDTVTITIAKDVEGKDQATTGRLLSAALESLMKQAKNEKKVNARTGSYRIWATSDNKGKTTGWHGQGEIILESKDFAAARELAAALSDDAAIANINFSLSREAQAAEERKLLDRTAEAFRQRAKAAATAFGFSDYRITRLELSGSGTDAPTPRPMMMAMMAARKGGADANPQVPLEPDTVTVTISVNGTIALK